MILLLLIAAIAIAGALRKPRPMRYWLLIAAALAWALLIAPYFFGASGTLDDPTGDGVITHAVRQMTADGGWMGVYAIGMIVLIYGTIVWLLQQALVTVKK